MSRTFIAVVLLAPMLRADDAADAAKQLADLLKPYTELVVRFHAATNDDEKKMLRADARQTAATVSGKLLALAKAHPATQAATDALYWVMTKATGSPNAAEAKRLFVANYLTSPRAGPFCPLLETDTADGEQYLRDLLARNPSKAVKLWAGVSLGRVIAAKRNPTEEQLREAEKLLAAARDEGRTVKGFPEEQVLAAEKALFELRSLTVGKMPPDLEGTTLDGKRAKLSDYRGKVLVVTVWATHVVPALEMIPGLQGLARKYAGQPFAMLSISCDPEKSRLTEFLKKEPMPWDHWWNGQKGGVLEAWTVNYFPTIYVFDAKGVIRYKNLNPKALDEAVAALLKEKPSP